MNSKRLTRLSYLTLSAVLCWLMALPAYAASEAGRILFARGTVSIVDDNDAARGGGTGSVFYEGDRVVTGSKSIVQLRLSDGALTALRSNSDYQIQRQRFDEEEGVYEQAGRLLSGWMRSVTGTIGARHPGNVSQGTSVATIGIRGTTYQIIHVPEQGLAEFPNLQPGSYVYLEEGQIEVSNEAGSRVVSPGQVVRIAGRNVAPELAPDLVGLFQSPLLVGAPADNDDFQVRNLLDDKTDQLVDEGAGSVLPEFDGAVAALVACNPCASFSVDGSTTITHTGTGNNKQLTSIAGVNDQFYLIDGYSPAGTGSLPIYRNGEMLSQVHWGRWQNENYSNIGPTDTPVNESGILHYIMADNVIADSTAIGSLGLIGSYRYNYAGGSAFTGADFNGDPVAGITMQNASHLVVNFGAMTVDAELAFSTIGPLSGSGSVNDLYDGFFYLDDYAYSQNGQYSGYVQGALVGDGAGIISAITIDDNFNYGRYRGTAAFLQEDSPLPAPKFGGVSAISAFNAGVLGTVVPSTLVAEENGTDWYPIQLTMNDGSGDYELARNTTTPLSQGSYTMGATGNTVYWGIWDLYTIGFNGDGVSPSGDWHYMIAEDTLTEAGVGSLASNLGLIGTHRYNYVGGTDLEEVSYGGSPTTIGSGYVDVNFADLAGTTGISASLDISSNTMAGSGSIGDLYGGGIGLVDDLDPIATGSITGTFAGTQVESLLGAVTYDYNTESYVGTALFERVNP